MLLKISKNFLYLSLFSVVIVMTSTFFPFIGGKYYFFRVSVELALIFFLLWWAFQAPEGEVEKQFRQITRKPIFIAVSAFVLFYLLASIFAVNPEGAFWSNFERGEGGFQMLHYYAFFSLLLMIFREWKDWKTAFYLSLAAAVLMIAYGIMGQGFLASNFINPFNGIARENIPNTVWGRLSGSIRFQGSLGNPAYVAPYLLFSMFFGFYLWAKQARKNKLFQHVAFGSLTIFFLVFFILSQTRGAFLGLVAAIFVFLMFLVVKSDKLRALSLSILLATVLFFSAGLYFKDSSFIQNLPGGRIFNIDIKSPDVQPRLWTWGSAWKGFLDRPVLGWGPENFTLVFDKYFDTRHFVPGKRTETWFDRAHSVVFDYLAETGFLGLFSYLAIFAVFYWMAFVKIFKREESVNSDNKNIVPSLDKKIILDGLVFAMPVAYFVQGLFLFDVLPIYLPLFLFLAFSSYRLSLRNQHIEEA